MYVPSALTASQSMRMADSGLKNVMSAYAALVLLKVEAASYASWETMA